MEAIVLAGGLGTRLRALLPELPKPLAPIAGRPFLEILLRHLASSGVARVVLSVGYKHEMIVAAIGSRFAGLAVDYAIEDQPMGTGGAIRLAAASCRAAHVAVLNGDSFLELDLRAMLAAHRAANARLTVGTAAVDDAGRYGSLIVRDGHVVGFAEKGVSGPGIINGGVYLMPRTLLEELGLPRVFSFERDVLTARLDALRPLVFPASGLFIDIGVPEDYARAQTLLAAR